MWQVRNFTRFAVERSWTRGQDGGEVWLVAVKCTFSIRPDGSTEVTKPQPPVVLAPEYIDPARAAWSSLRYDSDLVATKVATDIVVPGHAYAPAGGRVTELDVGVHIGPVAKRLRVIGDRVWHGTSIGEPRPFAKMPLVYERAYGGVDPETRDLPSPTWDVRNPVGRGFALSASSIDGQPAPNIEYPGEPIRRWNDRPQPAGFGPICAHWRARAQFAGTYDERWQRHRAPLLPEDFDRRFNQCAPQDQQPPGFLTGGESAILTNLTPAGELRFVVPRVHLGLETVFFTGEQQVHARPCLHTIIVEPDFPRVSVVWHSALPCHAKVCQLKETRVFEKQLLQTDDDEESVAEEDA